MTTPHPASSTQHPASSIQHPASSLRLLIRSTNWIGDAVMSMPAVQRLRELYPDAFIALLCPVKLHDLWRHNPFLNEVLTETSDLREKHFDQAVIFPNSFRSAWEIWRAGIPRRIGFAGHARRALLTDIVPEHEGDTPTYKSINIADAKFTIKEFSPVRHQVHHYLDLVTHLGGSREFVAPKIWLATEPAPSSTPVIALCAGAEYGPAKRWPADRFAEVARCVSRQSPCRWKLLGGPGDAAIANQIETALRDVAPVENLAGKTSLLGLCEHLKSSTLLFTNDTGPMHLAAALGTPLVAIFGSTSSELTGPLGERCTIIRQPVECSPCFLRECPIDFRCMKSVTVEQVTEAVVKQLCGSALPGATGQVNRGQKPAPTTE